MRRDLVMPGQRYDLAGRLVRVDVVYRDGRCDLTDGTVCSTRALRRTPDQRPGSRTRSEPWRARCATCDAPPYRSCQTRSGNPTGWHTPRLRALATLRRRTISSHAPTTDRTTR